MTLGRVFSSIGTSGIATLTWINAVAAPADYG